MIFHYLVEQKGYAGPSNSLQLCVCVCERSLHVSSQHHITLFAREFLVAGKSAPEFGGVAGLPVIENHLVSNGNATKARTYVCVFLLFFPATEVIVAFIQILLNLQNYLDLVLF